MAELNGSNPAHFLDDGGDARKPVQLGVIPDAGAACAGPPLRQDCQLLGEHEAETAIRTTSSILNFTKGSNFSLCHGLGGNADLLIFAAVVLNDKARMTLPDQVGEQGMEEIERQDLRWPCGVTVSSV